MERRRMACHTTPRLTALADCLENATSIADIGCDHAYLPILLAKRGISRKIIATDVREGPLRRARENIKRFGYDDVIETRLGSGLLPLSPGETEAIVIAGMGGTVICNILKEGERIARAANRLLLQPMSSSVELRQWLYQNGYTIVEETLVQEQARIYSILTVVSGPTGAYGALDCYISPALRRANPPLLPLYAKKYRASLQTAIDGLAKAQAKPERLAHYQKLQQKLEELIKQGDDKR